MLENGRVFGFVILCVVSLLDPGLFVVPELPKRFHRASSCSFLKSRSNHIQTILTVFHQQERIEKRITSAKKRLAEIAEEESDDEWSASLKDHLEMWENKKAFCNLLMDMDFLPGEVASDGNCGLWTVRSLEAGCFVQTSLTTKATVQSLREDF